VQIDYGHLAIPNLFLRLSLPEFYNIKYR